MWKRTILDIA